MNELGLSNSWQPADNTVTASCSGDVVEWFCTVMFSTKFIDVALTTIDFY